MKWSLVVLTGFLIVLASGCSDNSSGTGGDPFGPGGGGGGAVTWTIGSRQGQQGRIFTGQPSVAVTVTQVTVSLPAQPFQDVIQGDGTTVYQAGTVYDIGEYTGVATGQAWTLAFQGRIGNAQGQQYTVTSNYTVP